jgi:hypothetical protein
MWRHGGAPQSCILDQPGVRGVAADATFSGLPLVFCGSLKIIYDLALLITFRHIKPVSGGLLPRPPVKGGLHYPLA